MTLHSMLTTLRSATCGVTYGEYELLWLRPTEDVSHEREVAG